MLSPEEQRIRKIMEDNVELWLMKKAQARHLIVMKDVKAMIEKCRLIQNRRKAGLASQAAAKVKKLEEKDKDAAA